MKKLTGKIVIMMNSRIGEYKDYYEYGFLNVCYGRGIIELVEKFCLKYETTVRVTIYTEDYDSTIDIDAILSEGTEITYHGKDANTLGILDRRDDLEKLIKQTKDEYRTFAKDVLINKNDQEKIIKLLSKVEKVFKELFEENPIDIE